MSRKDKPRIMVDDMYDDVPQRQHPKKPKGSRKPKPLTRKYPKGTLPAYTADYAALGFSKKQAEAMGQLAYAQKQIRKRLESLEAMALATVLGRVEIQGDFHRLDCNKRDDHNNECSCGATPSGASKGA